MYLAMDCESDDNDDDPFSTSIFNLKYKFFLNTILLCIDLFLL